MSWQVMKISDFCLVTDFVANGSFESLKNNVEYLDGDGYAVLVRLTDFTKNWKGNFKYVSESAYKFLKHSYILPDDLLMSNVGEPGKVFMVPDLGKPMTLGPNSILIRPDSQKVIQKYLYYFFLSPIGSEKVQSITSGTTQRKFNKTSFRALEVNIPPLAMQHKIVAKLDAIFAEIYEAAMATEANVKNCEALFASFLNHVFNSEISNKKKFKLKDVCIFQGGAQPPKSFFEYESTNDNVRFIQIRDYKSDKNIVFIPKKLARRHCDITDVMIGRYGPPVFQILRGINGAYNVALMKAIPDETQLTKDYLFYFLQNPLIQDYVISLSDRAAGQSGLNKETIEPYEIFLPSLDSQLDEVNSIETLLKATNSIKNICQKKNSELISLKKSILRQAFNGELVKD